MYFLSRFDWLTVMWTQVLLQIQKRDLGVSWWFEQITQLIVQYQNATVVWMLQPLVVDVLVNGARDGTSRDQFTFWQFQKHTKLFGNDLLAVKPVVFGTLSRLFPVRVVLFPLTFLTILESVLISFLRAVISSSTDSIDILYITYAINL